MFVHFTKTFHWLCRKLFYTLPFSNTIYKVFCTPYLPLQIALKHECDRPQAVLSAATWLGKKVHGETMYVNPVGWPLQHCNCQAVVRLCNKSLAARQSCAPVKARKMIKAALVTLLLTLYCPTCT